MSTLLAASTSTNWSITLLPACLKDDLKDALLTRLLVVPDGDLWFVPWTAARLLADVDVRLLPSLPARNRRRLRLAAGFNQCWRSWTTMHQGQIWWSTRFHAARARGALQIAYSDDLPGRRGATTTSCSFFGHGAGRGLSYGLQTPRGTAHPR